MMKFPKITMLQAILACALIFALTTLPGLLFDGRNADDWRHLAGAPGDVFPGVWTTVEGRWAMDFLFVYVFAERFHTVIQAFLCFVTFVWISFSVARVTAPKTQIPLSSLLLFAWSANHIYMVQALSFSSHVFAFPLALAFSLQSFRIFQGLAATQFNLKRIFLFALAVQLLALSAGLYQAFAPFGLILLAIAMIRVDEYDIREIVRFVIIAGIGATLGVILYVVEWLAAVQLAPLTEEYQRFDQPTLASTIDKVSALPRMLVRSHGGGMMHLPPVLRYVNLAALGIVSGIVGWAALLQLSTRFEAALRILLGAALGLFIIPIIISFTYLELWVPARVVAYISFTSGAVLIAAITVVNASPRAFSPTLRAVGIALSALTVGIGGLVSSAAWNDHGLAAERDKELARAIYTRVSATEGYDGSAFHMSGGIDYPDLVWGGPVGWTVFHKGNPYSAIFHEMYDVDWHAVFVEDSPRTCSAFPAYDSVFLTENQTVHVCLQASTGR